MFDHSHQFRMTQVPSTSRDWSAVQGTGASTGMESMNEGQHTHPSIEEAYMSKSPENKPFTASSEPISHPSPHEELAQINIADLGLLSSFAAYGLASQSTRGLAPSIQLKSNSLSSVMREKFLVFNLNLWTKMVILFAPQATPIKCGYIKKDFWIKAYHEHVKPLLEPFISSVFNIEVETNGQQFNPSAHWITSDVLADLLEHCCPGVPIHSRRAAHEMIAPHHLWLTMQKRKPALLIPMQTSKPVQRQIYELCVQHCQPTADNPASGVDVDFFWALLPAKGPEEVVESSMVSLV
ncbi:hypothetical protein DFH28DRAFT_1081036 [Melampsora americana]|nr:hypothetical protein DFH28DRAFT_1081036 [Melampsora americana]